MMLSNSHVFSDLVSEDNGRKLKIAAKRYWSGHSAKHAGPGSVTVVLAHGSGFHKEHFEPFLQHLFALAENDGVAVIREAWALDWQSHGDSAVLNADVLGQDEIVSISVWGRALASFASSARLQGPIIAIGHSAGSSAFMYSTKFFAAKDVPYAAMLLIEPPLIDRDVFEANHKDRQRQLKFVTAAVSKSRASWPNKASALEYFAKRPPWRTWDRRVLELYVEHGLYQAPEGEDVVPKCPKTRESAAFVDLESTFVATEQIAPVSALLPLHIIFGAKNDMMPRYGQDSLIDASKGRMPASVTRVDGAGHLIVQEIPDRLAEVVYALLKDRAFRAKL
ncbi:alpha/beta-hydrolase [Peniophora sp. CONT]|nr:alpha/beta-hydrolase [Peniophora sp. CONT]